MEVFFCSVYSDENHDDVCETNWTFMNPPIPTRVLVVCLGNICRSPMAEGLLRHHIQTKGLRIKVDSAGTNGYHNGESPDSRAQAEMRRHGIEIAAQESRQLKKKDFERFDLILVMDASNRHDVLSLAGEREDWQAKVDMFLSKGDVPDPYYGGNEGFAKVYNLVNDAAKEWVERWSDVQLGPH